MDKENESKLRVGCIGAAAIIVAAILGWGMPFAYNIANRILPPFTPAPNIEPTNQISEIITTSPNLTQTSLEPYLCFGECWEYNDNLRTMIWAGITDGTEDIWQPAGEPLQKIRDGYTAIITTTVPGEIFACVLTVNGEKIKDSCDKDLYSLPPGTYQITSKNSSIGGFRWCPLIGYGWRLNGGECK